MVASSLTNLATLYLNQGAYSRAEPLFKRAVTVLDGALGQDHPYVAVALNNLAAHYHQRVSADAPVQSGRSANEA